MLAVPEHQGRISPVFDTCRTVLIFDDSKKEERTCACLCWKSVPCAMRPQELKEHEVAVLICGGISRWMARQLESQTILVIPWRSGGIKEVVRAYYRGQIMHARFSMPGCCRFRRRLGYGQSFSNFAGSPSGTGKTDDAAS